MLLIYNCFITCFSLVFRVLGFFNSKIEEGSTGRKNWEKQLLEIPKGKKIYWFHCASLGEFDQGLPVMNLVKKNNPGILIVVTFFSPSGFIHYHKRNHCVDFAYYLPFDTKRNAKKFLSILNPIIGIFVKYEFWPNFLNESSKKGIPIVSISTLLRPNQIYFKWYGYLFRNALSKIRFFFVQNESTALLLNDLGVKNFEVIGDTRFDRVIENRILNEQNNMINPNVEITEINSFLEGEKAIVFGSSWSPEEAILLSFLVSNSKQKIIIAPHDVSESNILSLEQKIGSPAIRFTKLKVDYKNQQVLILDTIGHLATAYSYGKIAFVGGGFSGSLHNILEPAVFGLPVLFGPNHSKFPEAESFIKAGIGFEIRNVEEFQKQIEAIETDLANLSFRTAQFVESHRGASRKIVENPLFKF